MCIFQVQGMLDFKTFLSLTNGALLLHYWLEAERLKHHLDYNSSELWDMTLSFKYVCMYVLM